MNCDVTLKANDFKTLHNSLCELDRMVGKLLQGNAYEGQKLEQIAQTLRNSLQDVYAQERNDFDRKSDHYSQVKEELGLRSIWSIFEVANLSERFPFEGVTRVVYKDHWGSTPVSTEINGGTWAALYVAADACIRDSGDEHHVFIEQFKQFGDTLVLTTGS